MNFTKNLSEKELTMFSAANMPIDGNLFVVIFYSRLPLKETWQLETDAIDRKAKCDLLFLIKSNEGSVLISAMFWNLKPKTFP